MSHESLVARLNGMAIHMTRQDSFEAPRASRLGASKVSPPRRSRALSSKPSNVSPDKGGLTDEFQLGGSFKAEVKSPNARRRSTRSRPPVDGHSKPRQRSVGVASFADPLQGITSSASRIPHVEAKIVHAKASTPSNEKPATPPMNRNSLLKATANAAANASNIRHQVLKQFQEKQFQEQSKKENREQIRSAQAMLDSMKTNPEAWNPTGASTSYGTSDRSNASAASMESTSTNHRPASSSTPRALSSTSSSVVKRLTPTRTMTPGAQGRRRDATQRRNSVGSAGAQQRCEYESQVRMIHQV